jgi:hypothetical protein
MPDASTIPYPADLSFGPDTRIVLIGTTSCPFDNVMLPPVPHAKANIDYLERLFKDPDICGLDDNCIVRVLDRENATEITEEIAKAADEATDTLIVYYVGHGLYGDVNTPLYLAARKTTEEKKAFNGVSVTLVKQAMKGSRARKRILILDCCYSGRAMDGGLAATDPEAAVEPAIDIEGTYGIAAVPADAKALAPPNEKFTRFTGALLDVLEHGLRTDEKVLTLEDVFSEVERKIGRKADAPLPKRINWDKGQRFCIARNRSLHRRELDRLYEAVEGLRETVTATGARLQAFEAKATVLDDLSTRLMGVESALTAKPGGPQTANETGESPRTGIWTRIGLDEVQWDLLPARPYKLHILRYFEGRKNALYLILGLLYPLALLIAAPFLGPSPATLSVFYVGAALTGLLGLGLAFVLLFDRQSGIASQAVPNQTPATLQLLESKEQLADILERRVVNFLGFALETGRAWLASVLMMVAATVSVAIHILRNLPTTY